MRIALISNALPPHTWGGTENYTAGLAVAFRKAGHDVHVLCGGSWEEGSDNVTGHEDSFYHGVAVRRVHMNWTRHSDPNRALYANPEMERQVGGWLDEVRPDVVHVTSCQRFSGSALSAVKRRGIPLVLSLTDFWFLCPRTTLLTSGGSNCSGEVTDWECLKCAMGDSKFYHLSRRLVPEPLRRPTLTAISRTPALNQLRGLRGFALDVADRRARLKEALTWPDRVITASSFVREVFRSNGVDRPIHVSAYGHDLDWLKNYSGKTSSAVVRFGFVGQCFPAKGLHILIAAAKLLHGEGHRDFRVVIYSDVGRTPSYGEAIRREAGANPIFEFRGTYRHSDSAAVYAEFDVLVVPSIWYDFPLVIQEAFATRTPVVASDLGGMAEAVSDNVNGLLFQAGAVSDLAAQLRRILTEPDLLPRLESCAPRVRSQMDEVTELTKFYADAVAVRAGKPPHAAPEPV